MRVDGSMVRLGQWWNHKVPPLIAVAALTAGAANPLDARGVMADLLLFVVSTVGVAAFGHTVNDLSDIESDARAGKANRMTTASARTKALAVLITLTIGVAPWIWLPRSAAAIGLLVSEVALLLAYSLPPLRLKERSAGGALADACYAFVVPILLAIAVFSARPGAAEVAWWVLAPVSAWALLSGIRGILWHQVTDADNDRAAGARTLALSLGVPRSIRVLGHLVVIELVAAAGAIWAVAVAIDAPWLSAVAVGYVGYRSFQTTFLWTDPVRPSALRTADGRVRLLGYVLINEFVEKWLPLAALIALAATEPWFWLAVAAHLVLFDNAAAEFLTRDLLSLPDAINRLAHERRARRQIETMRQRRAGEVRNGPEPVSADERATRRWVFVVCGPAMHVETLRTALRHLAPLTSLEIWVVTDSRRNEVPIDASGVHRVVDVATPEELDDHQASIWLKTSVHRHLPPGQWCYLDSDIIAVRPGAEQIFEHRRGPVAFASDLTISVNEVDRFSPWAMTCDCSGHGDTHSCHHLREQLEQRLGVTVPGSWVHWNGGVFVFGDDSSVFLDMWHRIAIESFSWPEWRTRDQGALIATVWLQGQQDCPVLPAEFNFIADLGNHDLCLDPDKGWALHPSGPWHHARMLHLYTSALEDPSWDLSRDVEAPVIRQTLVRTHRWRRSQVGQHGRDAYWKGRELTSLWVLRARKLPARLRPARIIASVRRRTGRGPADPTPASAQDGGLS